MMKEQGKKSGGPWDCYQVGDFFGWEAERVVAVTNGANVMELITMARNHLSVILVEGGIHCAKTKKRFQQAADLGLIKVVQLKASLTENIQTR